MTRYLTVSLDGRWVLVHQDGEQMPAELIARELGLAYGEKVRIVGCTFTEVLVEYDGAAVDDVALENAVGKIFDKNFGGDERATVLSFSRTANETASEPTPEPEPPSVPEQPPEQTSKPERPAEPSPTDNPPPAARADKPEKEETFRFPGDKRSKSRTWGAKDEQKSAASEEIARLVGCAQFKALAEDLCKVAPVARENNAADTVLRRAYLFSINDGHGLSACLDLLGRLLGETGIAEFADGAPKEVVLPVDKRECDELLGKFGNRFDEDGKRIVCFDISVWMDRLDTSDFRGILRGIENLMASTVPVFRIPFVDKEVLSHVLYVLNDRFTVKDVSFPPFSNDELRAIAELRLRAYGYTADEDVWEIFFRRIAEEKSDGRFYGVKTVEKLVREILYEKQLSGARAGNPDRTLRRADLFGLCASAADDRTGMEMLEALVGTEKIRDAVIEIVTQIELARNNPDMARPSLHMRFVGNPGTGKTTVARILGKILKERGVLSVGAFFEYGGRDFCGRYVGETAPKTASMCRDAYGSVLFIDEAYSLYRGAANSNDYGREALDTLIAEMENHREDFVVIMAGYPDDMDTLMKGNAGLASRMPYLIEFPNFTREQLAEIFLKMLTGRDGNPLYADDVPEAARAYFAGLGDDVIGAKDFGNARYVRNIVERSWAKAAMRGQLGGAEKILVQKDDFESAVRDAAVRPAAKKVGRIGFFD